MSEEQLLFCLWLIGKWFLGEQLKTKPNPVRPIIVLFTEILSFSDPINILSHLPTWSQHKPHLLTPPEPKHLSLSAKAFLWDCASQLPCPENCTAEIHDLLTRYVASGSVTFLEHTKCMALYYGKYKAFLQGVQDGLQNLAFRKSHLNNSKLLSLLGWKK